MLDRFAAFILTHRRPDRLYTMTSLRRSGYTGPIYLVVDTEDPTLATYQAQFGEMVKTFSKQDIGQTFDLADTFHARTGVIVFARNAVAQIAHALNLTAWIQLDDDYTDFVYKFASDGTYKERRILSLDKVFAALLTFQQQTPTVTLCMAQNGDFLGGAAGSFGKELRLHRKAMNTFVCSANKPFGFVGRINEDVNTYVTEGMRGRLLLTTNIVAIIQKQTQSNLGGMTELYLDAGTYLKSFYTVMMAPSCVKISSMGEKHRRIHHKVLWRYAVPKILSPEYRKNTRSEG